MKQEPSKKFSIRAEWLAFWAALSSELEFSEVEKVLVKQCFYAGYGAALVTIGDISDTNPSQFEFDKIMAGIEGEIDDFETAAAAEIMGLVKKQG